MAILAQRAALAAAPKPADRGPYMHGEQCVHRDAGDPPWELVDEDLGMWRRQCRQRFCGVAQYSIPDVGKPPPRPDEALLAGWSHSFEDMACCNHEPAIELELVAFDGEAGRRGLRYWQGKCRICQSTKRWIAEAAAHYRGNDVEVSPERDRVFVLDWSA